MGRERLLKVRVQTILPPGLSHEYYTVIWSHSGCSLSTDALTIKAGRLAKKKIHRNISQVLKYLLLFVLFQGPGGV